MTDEEFLGNRDAVLIFRCTDCDKIVTIVGHEEVHYATASQIAGESEKLFCGKCEAEY